MKKKIPTDAARIFHDLYILSINGILPFLKIKKNVFYFDLQSQWTRVVTNEKLI